MIVSQRGRWLHYISSDKPAVELGATEAVQQHLSRHVVASKPVSQRKLDFEHRRPRILRECMAEATGVFFYVYEESHDPTILVNGR